MAWKPVSNTVPQYHVSGSPASGYYLKFYKSGTTTAISMATDSTGGTTLAKCAINSEGYPINGSSAVFIPHINQPYKVVLYTNSTDADADTTGNAAWIVDALSHEAPNTSVYELGSTAAATSHPAVTGYTIATNYHDSNRVAGSGGNFRFTGTTTAGKAGDWPNADGYFYDADGKQFAIVGVANVLAFGAVGDGTTDDTNAWRSMLATSGKKTAPDGTYRLTGQLVILADTDLAMSANCVLYRDWAGTTGDKLGNATLRNENAVWVETLGVDPGPATLTNTDDNIVVTGGRIRPASSSQIGCGYVFTNVSNLRLNGCVIERTYDDWAFTLGGSRIVARGISVLENVKLFEDGVHIVHGSEILIEADIIQSGDDAFAVGTNYNMPISDVTIYMGHFRSEKGHAGIIVQYREGTTAGYATPTQKIQRIKFLDGTGAAGISRNGLFRVNTDGIAGLVEDVTLDNITLDALEETHDGTSPIGVQIANVKRLTLDSVLVQNARRDGIDIQDCDDVQLLNCRVPGIDGDASHNALRVEDTTNMTVVGGLYEHHLAGPVEINGASDVHLVGPTVAEIKSSSFGVIVNGSSKVTGNFKAAKLSGATSTYAITLTGTSSAGISGGDFDGVDNVLTYSTTSGDISIKNNKGGRKTYTIASGSINCAGAEAVDLLAEGGASDTLAAMTGGYKGQRITLRNGEASPGSVTITLSNGTGSNQLSIGSNYILDDSDKALIAEYNGTLWREIARI